MDVAADTGEASDPSAPFVIFSNLGSRDKLYDTTSYAARPIVGREVNGMDEEWAAVRFIPKVDVQATVLEAAVGHTSGTKLLQLGIYDNDPTFGTPGTLLPGGQGSTNDIPDTGECCQLVKVTLSGTGVTLTAGTIYWLVVSTDDVHGVSFDGVWQASPLVELAVFGPTVGFWTAGPGQWPPARIRGTRLGSNGPLSAEVQEDAGSRTEVSRPVKIFSNLDPLFAQPYLPASGVVIAGSNVLAFLEQWRAIPFTPRANVQAKNVSAAVDHVSGTNQINLGLYTDDGGVPGSPLPGAQGSVADLPDEGECCDFATLRLAGEGVALTGGTQYWLVVSPDNVNAPNFMGFWQVSSNNLCATLEPRLSSLWTPFSGLWVAAQVYGQGD